MSARLPLLFLIPLLLFTGCGNSNSFPPDGRRTPLGSVQALPPVTSPAWREPAWLPAPEDDEWPVFGRTADRRQHSPLDLPSKKLELLWSRRLSEHTYRYRRGTNLWSESPVVCSIDGRMVCLLGAYDKRIHAFEALTGKPIWRFTTGDEVVATPVCVRQATPPLIVAASTDRVLYGLDALAGEKRWARDTLSWTYTTSPGVFASPALFSHDGRPAFAAGYFVNDIGRGQRLQQGWAAAWQTGDGVELWKLLLTTTRVYGPAMGSVAGRPIMIFATADGTVQALDGRNGQVAWRFTTDERIRACPTLATGKAGPTVLIPTSWGILWALNAETGKARWSYKADLLAEGSASVTPLADGRQLVTFGTYDRCLHGLDLDTGKRLWRFATKGYVVASPASCTVQGRPVLFCPSMDSRIYGLDARTGVPFWEAEFGALPWPFVRRGDAVFSSPVVFGSGAGRYLLFPAHDGVIYCYHSSPRDEPSSPSP